MNAVAEKSHLSLPRKLEQLKTASGDSSQVRKRFSAFQLTAGRGLALLYLILVSLVAWTWCGTADVLIDFGRELYVPWQMLEGKQLYQDIAYFNGPLSPYFNAFLFRLFGVSVVTLVVVNALLLATLVTILYSVLLRYFSVVASTMACSCMLIVFGVAHTSPYGNYNYITPYSHEMTHGLVLAFAILALLRHDEKFKFWKWSLIGVFWGLVFLGKGELFLAVTSMLVCSLALPLFSRRTSLLQIIARICTAVGFAALPIFAFWLLLCRHTSPAEASLNVLGTWRYIFASDVTSLYFYRRIAGLTYPLWYLWVMVRYCVALGCVLLGLFALERNIGGRGWRNPFAGLSFLFVLYVGGFSAFILHDGVFTLIATASFLTFFCLAIRRRENFCQYHHLACWAVFSAFLMTKIALRPTLVFYGFALTMPVVVLAVAMAIDWLPRFMSRDGLGRRCRVALIALLLADMSLKLASTLYFTYEKSESIGSGPDHLRCKEKQAVPLKAVTAYLSSRMRPDETLLVLPEGITMNYLLRRANNSPYVNFMQPELVMYGEENILADFQSNPSDYVLLVSRGVMKDYGLDHFGQAGYGDKIMTWIRANYVIEQQFGADPFLPGEFGVQILRRQSPQTLAAEHADEFELAQQRSRLP